MPLSAQVGAQLWLEQDSRPERIRMLVERAAESGIGVLRIFLVWPWIEPRPDQWIFDIYDEAFAAAAATGIGIKATLGPDSPPWHAGTPGLVQSGHLDLPSTADQRELIRRYVHACVERYARHPALAQWILWNEPMNLVTPPGGRAPRRSAELHARWAELLRRRYGDDLAALNSRWHTGYPSFDEVRFPEEILHPAHRPGEFFSFDPWLAECELRAEALRDELAWVHELIRARDPHTPTCFNPPDLFRNHAVLGYDLATQSSAADVFGASIHAPWHLGFAERAEHVALVAAGIGMLKGAATDRPVELTEVQAGDVYRGSPDPGSVTGAELAATYLAALFSGATSVSGWALNARRQDFEAGDWSLLDFDDAPGPRSAYLQRVAGCLDRLADTIGDWAPVGPEAAVLYSTPAQALQLVQSWRSTSLPGRGADEAIQGAGLIAGELLHLGVAARPVPLPRLATGDNARASLVVGSHLVAWSEDEARLLLDAIAGGRTLLLDGTAGQFDLRAGVHREWPAHLVGPLGVRAKRFDVRPDGHPLRVYGLPAGRFPLVRTEFAFTDDAWSPVPGATFADGSPVAWQRPYGAGRALLCAGPLGPAHVHDPSTRALLRLLVDRYAPDVAPAVRPRSPDAVTLRVSGPRGTAFAALAPPATERAGRPLGLAVPPGRYHDLWTDSAVTARADGVDIPAVDGIAVVVDAGLT